MLTNKELTPKEFAVSLFLKRANLALADHDIEDAKEQVFHAMKVLHNKD